MTDALVMRRKVLGAALESTKGTFNAPTVRLPGSIVYDPKMKMEGLMDDGEREPASLSMGRVASVPGVVKGRLTFRTEGIYEDSTLLLLQGCGFSVTGKVATATADQAAKKTISFRLWEDGRLKELSGASGTFTVEAASGGRVFFNWDFMGVWRAVVDTSVPSAVPIVTKGFQAKGMTLTAGGSALPRVSQFSLSMNGEVVPLLAVDSTNGVAYFTHLDHAPQLMLDTEARLVAGNDAWGLLLAGTAQAVVATFLDSAGNSLKFDFGAAQRREVDDAERENVLIDSLTLDCTNSTAGNDDVKITEAAAA